MARCLLCDQEFLVKPTFWKLLLQLEEGDGSCPSCQSAFERIGDQHCPSCYKVNDGQICQDCLYWQDQGYQVNHQALYVYNPAMKAYMSRYKFFGDYVLARLFAKDIRQALRAQRGYVVVPVPVSRQTLAERGFNQVEGLLLAAGVAYQDLLTKGEGAKQSSKTRQERLTSTPDYVLLGEMPLPQKIILVDDVYTTGATIASIIRLFRENGVEEVKSFSLSR